MKTFPDKPVGNSCAVNGLGNSPAHTQRQPAEFSSPLSEVLLETAIEVARQRMCEGASRAEKIDAWREMAQLIAQRTPHRVRFMERMRGIG